MEGSASLLPRDALRHVFSCLDWRSLVYCSCACRGWHEAAHEDELWLKHLHQEYFRPLLVAYSAAKLPAGWQDPSLACSTAAAAAGDCILDLLQPSNVSCCSAVHITEQQRLHDSSRAPSLLKDLFAAGRLHATVPHQALLARFTTAILQITGWRLLITHSTAHSHSTAHAQDAVNTTQHLSTLSLHPPSDAPGNSGAATSNPQSSSTGSSSSSALHSHSSTPTSSKHVVRNPSSNTPADGLPAPLTLQALQSGGWVCGCVLMQQQEQSCWIRFHLPDELRTDAAVAQALQQGHLAATVQGLGPLGWFDVATAEKFELPDNDMEILLQSHRTGFYAWDHVDEDGIDRYGQLEPLPWDLRTGQHQAQMLSSTQQHQPQQQQQQVHQVGLDLNQNSGSELPQLPQLRMLVYVHYEQLLQVLPWDLPHSLPLPTGPVLNTAMDFSRLLLSGWCSLWLQLDVCQLHGGFKLGTCVVPLRLRNWDAEKPRFECIEDQVLVVLHTPDSSINSTQGVAAAAGSMSLDGEAAAGSSTAGGAAGLAQPALAGFGTCSFPDASQSQAASAAGAAAGVQSLLQVMNLEACQQVFLGDVCLHGAGNCSVDGSIMRTAAYALKDLMNTDEIMVDFALFDATGHPLMGRAGVEVWNQEVSESASIQKPGQRSTAGCSTAAHNSVQDTAATAMQPTCQQPARLQSALPPSLARLENLARCIGPVGLMQEEGGQNHVELCEAAWVALSQADGRLTVVGAPDGLSDPLLESQHYTGPWVEITHNVQKLHFLVDDVQGDFWDTCIVVDVDHQVPAASIVYGTGLPCSTISMRMSWENLRGLFGLPPR